VDRDSSVGIANRYGLDGPGIESRWEARFSATVQTGSGNHPASHTVGTGSLSCVDKPPHVEPRLKREYSYISTPLLGVRGLFYGDLFTFLLVYTGRNG
jgi:hypothetical protein